ncbi:protein RRP5 homolog [Ctenocephalides felis]|uniref:protein RRP5 homolog n=1 Tax=Ctenocephalides felis TaxID=7515 RepID=UPI000E6E2E80|nr:protein RRP5 homolog [Ctenocephalides felis]
MDASLNDFPRGGQIVKKNEKQKATTTLFGNTAVVKTKKKTATKKQRQKALDKKNEKHENSITPTSFEGLCYKSIKDGMIILGCVHKVNEMAIQVSLPGRIYGYVMVTNISKPYSNNLQKFVDDPQFTSDDHKTLKQMFSPGQLVCVKVLAPDAATKFSVNLSLDPCDTHKEIKSTEITTGSIHMVAVQSIEDHGYVVDFGITRCRAFLPNSHVPQKYGRLGIGELIWCSVSKITSTPLVTTMVLSALEVNSAKSVISDVTSLNSILPGMRVEATIEKILKNGLQLKFMDKYIGYVGISYLKKLNCDTSKYNVGQIIDAIVLYIVPTVKITYLAIRDLEPISTSENIKIGDTMQGKVISRSAKGIYLSLPRHARGFIPFKRVKTSKDNDLSEMLLKFTRGTTHCIRILSFDFMDNSYICSNEKNVLNEKIFTINDLTAGQIVSATVQNVNNKRLMVKVGNVVGVITSLHVSDFPIQKSSMTTRFTVDQTVKCKVLDVNTETEQLYLTMKPSLMENTASLLFSMNDAQFNKIYKGVVVQIIPSGLVVVFFNGLKGFLPKQQFGFQNAGDSNKLFFVGQVIDCTIVKIDKSSSRMTLSMNAELKNTKKQNNLVQQSNDIVEKENVELTKISKHKLTENNKSEKRDAQQIDSVVAENYVVKKKRKVSTASSEQDNVDLKKEQMDVSDCEDQVNKNDTEISIKKNHSQQGLLKANDFFNMSAECLRQNTTEVSSSEESEDESETIKKKVKSKEKEETIRNDEKKIRENELKFAESYENPQSADHFDRLLLANPNDSKTWINYMAYHLQGTEIEKARAVARKAFSNISFREEQEKLNVWIALLNLENHFGTKETFNETLQEALQTNDAYSIHMQAIQMLSESYKVQELSDLINKVLKKYSHKLECWLDVGRACFKAKLVDKARQIMQKGLNVLENNRHVDLLTRFAFMENQFENSDRAQALLEQVLTSYPRRIDIWSQYIDMLIKNSQIDIARDVLRRASSLSLPAKKMKVIFKKFLDFENKFGDEDAVNKVRQMAEEFVKKATN